MSRTIDERTVAFTPRTHRLIAWRMFGVRSDLGFQYSASELAAVKLADVGSPVAHFSISRLRVAYRLRHPAHCRISSDWRKGRDFLALLRPLLDVKMSAAQRADPGTHPADDQKYPDGSAKKSPALEPGFSLVSAPPAAVAMIRQPESMGGL
jgi:hypothetical protein